MKTLYLAFALIGLHSARAAELGFHPAA